MHRPLRVWLAIITLIVLTGCTRLPKKISVNESASKTPGTLVNAEFIDDINEMTLRYLFWSVKFPEPIDVDYSIRLYRVLYWTTKPDGSPAIASGLFSVPKTKKPSKSVVAYLHGTTTLRTSAPSGEGMGEGALLAGVYAGGGHLLVAPDYLGLGSNRDPHPYMVTEATANASIDLLKASRELAKQLGVEWPEKLYLTGFSQGGYATAVVHRELEAHPVPGLTVAASAPVAGAFDLQKISFPTALAGGSTASTLYLAYVVTAYAGIYGQPINSVIAEPYAEKLPGFFDGEDDFEPIAAALPKNPREMFTKSFLDDYDAGRKNWFLDALAKNSVYGFAPKVPVRLYYGTQDKDVSPTEAPAALADWRKAGGSDIEAICVGDVDHEGSMMSATPKIRRWFDELNGGK